MQLQFGQNVSRRWWQIQSQKCGPVSAGENFDLGCGILTDLTLNLDLVHIFLFFSLCVLCAPATGPPSASNLLPVSTSDTTQSLHQSRPTFPEVGVGEGGGVKLSEASRPLVPRRRVEMLCDILRSCVRAPPPHPPQLTRPTTTTTPGTPSEREGEGEGRTRLPGAESLMRASRATCEGAA